MSKIFGIDLGTNSIGWALRDPDMTGNQIEKFGVLTFNKGVGMGKTGEYSYAAERTKKRSTRRLYQSRKYRLWATLEYLINEGYCPLSIEDLNKWRHYNKEEAVKNNNGGRLYPINNVAFDQWIKLDFNKDGVPDYTSPYQLRKELAEIKLDFNQEENRFKLGRALYHIAQRRGFKSSRKGAEDLKEKELDSDELVDLQYSEKKKNKEIVEAFDKYPQAKTIGWLFALMENDNIRIRENKAQYAIRENYKDEIKYVFDFQGLGYEHILYTKLVESGRNRNDGSIFYKRPLRSQKGLIGLCTFEQQTRIDKKTGKQYQTGKYRAPISYPSFETFRAFQFLNSIKYKPFIPNVSFKNNPNEAKQLEVSLIQEIFNKFFFRKSKPYFQFSEIIEFIKAKGCNWDFNYKPKSTVTACPVCARLKDILGDDYLQVKIPKAKAPKSEKAYYSIEDIWHVLFSYEDQEFVVEFAEQKLNLSPDKVKQFVTAWNMLPVGYGMLSINAINKINRFLQKGLIYTEAVLLANIPEIVGEDLWKKNESVILQNIGNVIDENREQKSILIIVNNLVSKHRNLESGEKFGYKDSTYRLDDTDLKDIYAVIEDQFGINKWKEFSEGQKQRVYSAVKDCYQAYFSSFGLPIKYINDERYSEVQSSGKKYYKSESGYYRLPKLIDTLGEFLKLHFSIDDKALTRLYHPSELDIYPPAKADAEGILKLGSPKTGSFKNPMAMRTLHELRKLMNYMIETGQIDTDTRVVVEVARDLNDSNKRWAIEAWQRQREAENQEFAYAIQQIKEGNSTKEFYTQDSDIDKMRLWYEQNDEEAIPPLASGKKEIKGIKWSENKKDSYKQIVAQKSLIDKYRLWKEQECQCIYTGKMINLSDLFNDNVIDFEHTIPRSKSFDNSLANLTVCYASYNKTIKKNKIPTQLNNYDEDSGGYSAILPRLKRWEEKIERIKQQIDFWKTKSKKSVEKQWKDDAIRQRHLWEMELEYWQNKLNRFTLKEITSGFKNSQKVDTQLISKYAFHYLKTYFEKVDVQKGSITAEFRKIYGLQEADKKKDRSKHSHHAKDAAVLTLIPVSAKRDAILEKYYESKESYIKFSDYLPYKGFKREYITCIDDKVLINNITNNQELTPAKRKVRKRGKEQLIPCTNKTKWATGDSIRGQLHQETFYGAIKPAKQGEYGNLLKDEEGKFIQEEKVKYVLRVPFQFKKDANTSGFKTLDEIKKAIVDEGLKAQIEQQVKEAGGLKEAFEKGIYLLDKHGNHHGNKIRHIRVWANVTEPLAIKKQTNLSKAEYKQHYWAANATNSFFAIYAGEGKKDFDFRNLFETAQLMSVNRINNPKELFESSITITKGKKSAELLLTCVLENGVKVLFKRNESEDLKSLDHSELLKRLYVYTNFEKDGRLNFKYHMEARSKIEEQYSESDMDFVTPKPTLRFGYAKYDFAVEGYDFYIKPDGIIDWKVN